MISRTTIINRQSSIISYQSSVRLSEPPMPTYYFIQDNALQSTLRPPVGLMPMTHARAMAQPLPLTALHQSMHAWGDAGLSPGPITPQSVFVGPDGGLAFLFEGKRHPAPLTPTTGAAQDVAAWFVLLDKTLPTDAVIGRARDVWPHEALVTALPFVTPVFLPNPLVRYPPDNWQRVARALAAVAAGN
jgi:hypothetical protein